MPTHDWQFWVVTVIAVIALLWLGRSVMRVALPRKKRRGVAKRTTLTMGGKAVRRSRGGGGPGA